MSSGYLDNRGKLNLMKITNKEACGFRSLCCCLISTGDVNKIVVSKNKQNELILGCQSGLFFAEIVSNSNKEVKKDNKKEKDLVLVPEKYIVGKRVC